MITPKDVTQKDAAVMAKIAVKDDQYCPETKEQLQVLIKYPDIPLDAINTADITDMSRLFEKSKRKDFAGINTWDTSAVTDMSYMFAGCERFNEELGADIPATSLVGKLLKRSAKSRFDTSKVTNMAHMFEGCKDFNKPLKLNTANCENFASFMKDCNDFNSSVEIDTRSATNMNRMFERCISFNQALNLDTAKVKNMSYMFRECIKFNQALNFDTSACENFNAFLVSCTQFNQPLSFDTSKAKKLNLMFEKCVNLDSQLEFDLSAAEDISRMFSECTRLTKTPILNNLNNVTKAEDVFKKCDKLSGLPDMSAYNKADSRISKSSAAEKKYHPKDRDELIELINDLSVHLGDIDTSAITEMSRLCSPWCCKRTDWSGIGDWDTSNVTAMRHVLYGIENFNEPLNWDTSNVTDMISMFNGCKSFNQPLNFDTSKVINMCGMFDGCESFNQPLNFDTSKVTDMNSMFNGCKSFNQSLNFDTSKVTSMFSMFEGCESFNQPLKFNTSNVENMQYMLSGCKNFDQKIEFDFSALQGCDRTDDMFKDVTKMNASKINIDASNILKFSNSGLKGITAKSIELGVISVVNGKARPNSKELLEFLCNDPDYKLGDIDTSLITDMDRLFKSSKRTDFSGIGDWDTSNVTTMIGTFRYKSEFNEKLNWDTSKVTHMSYMFEGCKSFNSPINFDTKNVIAMDNMFAGCINFNQKLDFDTSKVKKFTNMFENCENLEAEFSFDISSLQDCRGTFEGCKKLKTLPFAWSRVEIRIEGEFCQYCVDDASNWEEEIKQYENDEIGPAWLCSEGLCGNLVSGIGCEIDSSVQCNSTDHEGMLGFSFCENFTKINKEDAKKIITFEGCENGAVTFTLDIAGSSFDVDNVVVLSRCLDERMGAKYDAVVTDVAYLDACTMKYVFEKAVEKMGLSAVEKACGYKNFEEIPDQAAYAVVFSQLSELLKCDFERSFSSGSELESDDDSSTEYEIYISE